MYLTMRNVTILWNGQNTMFEMFSTGSITCFKTILHYRQVNSMANMWFELWVWSSSNYKIISSKTELTEMLYLKLCPCGHLPDIWKAPVGNDAQTHIFSQSPHSSFISPGSRSDKPNILEKVRSHRRFGNLDIQTDPDSNSRVACMNVSRSRSRLQDEDPEMTFSGGGGMWNPTDG